MTPRIIFFLLFAVVITQISLGQFFFDFGFYHSDLKYDKGTISKMKEIVNEKNKEFKSKPTNTYYAPYQSIGHTIILDGEHKVDMIADIEADIPFVDFMKKYPNKMIEENVVLVKSDCRDKRIYWGCHCPTGPEQNYNTCNVKTIHLSKNQITNFDIGEPQFFKKNDSYWLYTSSHAIYVVNSFEKKQLPKRYAQMLDYSRFMVSEDLKIYTSDEPSHYSFENEYISDDINNFFAYINSEISMPVKPTWSNKEDYKKQTLLYEKEMQERDACIRDLSQQQQFKDLIKAAVLDTKKCNVNNYEFEKLVEKYYSPKVALDLKRGKVSINWGFCGMGMDFSKPSHRYQEIARLSALASDLDVFMKTHMETIKHRSSFLNDNELIDTLFTYEWDKFNHIKDMEAMNIRIPDLALGTIIKIEEDSENRYFVGLNEFDDLKNMSKAIGDIVDTNLMEEVLLSMITDTDLDDYNRILGYYTFLNYCYRFPHLETRQNKLDKLKLAIQEMPEYVCSKIADNTFKTDEISCSYEDMWMVHRN